jgi:polyhydroxybutyrate depolymerase
LPAAALAALLAGCGSTGEPEAPAGPGAPTGAAMPARGTGTVDVGGRPVTVHVPASYDPGTAAPLVIALHGYTSNAAELESYLRLTPEADRRGFVYAYPDGSTGSRGERFWNATDACCSFGGSGPDDSRYLSDLITKIQDTYRIDRGRVYVLGHSNGGFMSFRMACDHAAQITAIATINGATWADAGRCKPSEPVSVLAIHSSADETIAHSGGTNGRAPYPSAAQTVAQWVAHDRCAGTATDAPALDLVTDLPGAETVVREYAQGCAGGSAVRSWTINGGKHVPALGPAFAPAMLDFLLARSKPAR